MSNTAPKGSMRFFGFAEVAKDPAGGISLKCYHNNRRKNAEEEVFVPVLDKEAKSVLSGVVGSTVAVEGRITGWNSDPSKYSQPIRIMNYDKIVIRSSDEYKGSIKPKYKLFAHGVVNVIKAEYVETPNTHVLNMDTDVGKLTKFYNKEFRHPPIEAIVGKTLYVEGRVNGKIWLKKETNETRIFTDIYISNMYGVSGELWKRDFNSSQSSQSTSEPEGDDILPAGDNASYEDGEYDESSDNGPDFV